MLLFVAIQLIIQMHT